MKKTYTNLEVLNIIAWFNQLPKEKADAIPIKIKYALKKVINKIEPDAKQFEEFREQETMRIKDKYFTDEQCNRVAQTIVDKDGNPVVDENGVEQTEEVLVIKDEFKDALQDEIDTLNEKITEILQEKNDYEYNGADVASMVDNLPDDTPLEWDDINIIDGLLSEEA